MIGKRSWNHGSICDWSSGLLQNLFSWDFLNISRPPRCLRCKTSARLWPWRWTLQHVNICQPCGKHVRKLPSVNLTYIIGKYWKWPWYSWFPYKKWWFSSSQTVNFPGDTMLPPGLCSRMRCSAICPGEAVGRWARKPRAVGHPPSG